MPAADHEGEPLDGPPGPDPDALSGDLADDAVTGLSLPDAIDGRRRSVPVSAAAASSGVAPSRVTRFAPLILAVLVAMPILAALVKMIGDHWYPAGDMAQAELHMRGFLSRPPLVGAAGRIVSDAGVQGSHPGPSLWVAMLPVYLLGGRTSFALMAAVVSVHLAAIVLALWLAMRRGGLLLAAIVAMVLAFVVRASGPSFAIEPWNPWLAVLPFAVFVLAAWSVLDGARGCWLLTALAGSYVVQCHIGYAPLVAAVMLGVFVADVVAARRRNTVGKSSRMWFAALAATGLMWLPPLLDQVKRSPGNASILWQHFLSPTEPYLSRGTVVRILAEQLNLAGPWLKGPTLPGPAALGVSLIGVIALVVLWSFAALRARRRGDGSATRLHVLLAATAFVGLLAVSRIFGGYFEYTSRWLWVLAALIVAAALWSLAVERSQRDQRIVTLVATAAVVVAGVMGSLTVHDRVVVPGASDSEMVGQMAPIVAGELDPDLHYLVRWKDSAGLGATAFGLMLELERQGYHVGVDLPSAAAALPHRFLPEQSASGVIQIITGAQADTYMVPVFSKVLAVYNPRNELQTARYAILRTELLDWARATGRDDVVNVLAGDGGSLVFINPPLPVEQAEKALELQRLPQPALILLNPPPAG